MDVNTNRSERKEGGSGPLFPLGRLLATPGALEAFIIAEQRPENLLVRHLTGDWGEVCAEDRWANDLALWNGERILSAYTLKSGERVWIITEADRARTTILLPDEY